MKEYLKAQIDKLETYSRIKKKYGFNGGITDFKNGYQPRTNTVKNDKGDLVAVFHSILARWRDNFTLLLNAHRVSDVKQTEIHTAEPLAPEPRAFEDELAIEKVKSHKSPGIV
jgi:hypothetical protein